MRELFLGIFFWACFTSAATQNYYFDKISSLQGLSQSTVWNIAQDRKGFLWFATMDGLNCYDGYSFKVYRNDPEDTSSLANSEISRVYEDRRGRLWIGLVKGGVNLFERSTERCQRICKTSAGEDLSAWQITGFAEDHAGNIWISSSRGIYCIDPQQRIQKIHFKQSRGFNGIFADSKQRIWIGSNNGWVYRQRGISRNFEAFPLEKITSNPYHRNVAYLIEDREGHILAGSMGSGLFRFEPKEKKFKSLLFFSEDFERRNISRSAAIDQQGRIWVGTDAGLLLLGLDQGQCTVLDQIFPDLHHKGGLNNHSIQTLCFDRFNNLWIGMWQGDVNVLYANHNRFGQISKDDGLPVNKTMGIATHAQDIWVATRVGVTRFSPPMQEPEQILRNKDITLIQKYQHQLFVASWDEGFYLIDPLSKRMKRYYAQEKSPNSVYFRVNAAHFSQRGLWMGDSEGSLYRFDFEQEKIVLLKNGLTSSSITAIYRGAGTKLWVGTYGEGLWCYDVATQQINPINLSQGTAPASQKHINTLVEDAQHHLWVGTNGGLFQIEAHTGRIHFYSSRNGLASNVVHGIVATAKSELWLSTNDGICRFNPTNKTCRNYNVQDGLHGKEFMPNALHQAADGRIFFGGLHGVNFFHPDSLREDATLPEVYLSKLLLPNRKIKPNQLHKPIEQNIQDRQSLRLSYAQAASLTFEYVGLYFKKTKRCTYAYKLEGFDRNWNTVGYQRSATYTNLNPGVYRFWVKAANSDGVWNPKASSIELRILPPWYLSNWAFGAYFTLFVLSLLVYRNYVRSREALKARLRLKELEAENLQELDQLKTNFFTNISHELRTPLTLILDPVEELIKTPQLPSKRVHEWYSTIQFNAQSLLRLINQLLDLSKLDAQRYLLHLSYSDVVDHCAKVVHLFDYPFEKRRVELIFDADPQSLFGWFDADALEKILNNLISNALKATPAKGKVSVSLTGINPRQGEAEILQIRVEDTGVGIPPEQLPQVFQRFFQTSTTRQSGQSSTGIGLALTAELVRLHRGEVNIESEPGVGTRFVVQIPLRAEVYPAEWRLPENQEPDATELEHPALLPPVYQHDPLQERQHLHLHDKVVLVAEDNAEMQNYLRYKLTDHYTVHTVANGREALHCALKKVPDLIISDLMMPEMDGIELCRAVKENEKTSHIPVILLTSRSVVESQLDGLKSGADDYLTKPFKSEILLARIENLLEQRQKLRERYMQAAQNSSITIPDIPIADTDSQFLQKVIAIIDTNLSNSSFNVDELERALNMSEMQLYRKLSSLTSMGGNAFIRHIRLKRASQLLEASNLSVGEIAYKVGFNSHSYFSKIYKREFGEPPTLKKK